MNMLLSPLDVRCSPLRRENNVISLLDAFSSRSDFSLFDTAAVRADFLADTDTVCVCGSAKKKLLRMMKRMNEQIDFSSFSFIIN